MADRQTRRLCNFQAQGESDQLLKDILKLYVGSFNGDKVAGYEILPALEKPFTSKYGDKRTRDRAVLILCQYEGAGWGASWDDAESMKGGGFVPFPFKMSMEQAGDFAAAWLAEQDYGRAPGTDGSAYHGWEVFTDRWGHVFGRSNAIIGISPSWIIYGK